MFFDFDHTNSLFLVFMMYSEILVFFKVPYIKSNTKVRVCVILRCF